MAYVCKLCDYIFIPKKDKNKKDEEAAFRKLPKDWKCPECGAKKSSFVWVEQL